MNATVAVPQNSPAPDTSSTKLTIFISYIHEDFAVAGALSNAIQDAFGSEVSVFIDKVSIQQGENIRASIEANLKKADILAVVSTGIEAPRLWAGFEIGFFLATHQGPPPVDHPLWGNLVSFYSGNAPAGPMDQQKHVVLGFDKFELEKSPEDFAAQCRITDQEPLLLWFGQVFNAIHGDNLEGHRRIQDTYKSIVLSFWKSVFAEFKQRPKLEVKPQKQLKIRFNAIVERTSRLDDDAQIELLGNAHTIFGIFSPSSSRTLSWKEFCAALVKVEGSLATFWTGTLIRILAKAVRASNLDEVSTNLIWSQSERKLFRLILTTYTTYYNGAIEASIYVVEVLRPKDHGDPRTTLLAKGLQSAMRFRSLFLEDKGLFNYLNITYPRDGLAAVAADIVAELDYLNMDLVASDLQTAASWQGVLTAEQIEEMAGTWEPLKKKLLDICVNAIAASDDVSVQTAKAALAATLREIQTRVGPLSDGLLKGIAVQLMDVAEHGGGK